MTTETLKTMVNKWDKTKNTVSDLMLAEIAYQLSRRTDLLEAQFEYDKQRDMFEDNHRIERDSLLTEMSDSVKVGMNVIGKTTYLTPPVYTSPSPSPNLHSSPDTLKKMVPIVNKEGEEI